jgi:riboflavin kinase/FMN adenylyltransferase
MEIVSGLDELDGGPRALAIGMFDGVHGGHRSTIERAIELGRERGLTSTVLTFDRHPLSVIDPARAPQLLTSLEERVRLIGELGPDQLVLLPFDTRLAAMSAEAFCAELLAGALRARVVVVGENFNFGAGGEGDAASLGACGRAHGFETVVLRLTTERGDPISSTRIRSLLRAGDIEEVREILGRPPSVSGRVGHGEGRGRTLGVPTANLVITPQIMRPGRGVYVARACVAGVWYRAAVNIGLNPTFQTAQETAPPVNTEAYLLGFDGDLYDRELRLEFLHKIRDERRFHSVDELVAEMRRDIAIVESLPDEAFVAVGLPAGAS